MKVVLLIVSIASATLTFGQTKNQKTFKLPHNARYSPGRVLVKIKNEFKDQVSQLSAGRVKNNSFRSIGPIIAPELSRKGASLQGPRIAPPTVDISRYFYVQFDPSRNIEDFVNQLYSSGYFEIVEPEYIQHTDYTPNDPSFSTQYYLQNIKAPGAWDITQGSEDIIIGIVDSGGQLSHPDFAGNLYVNPGEIANNGIDDDHNGYIDDVQGWDFIGADTLNLNNPSLIGDNNPNITHSGEVGHGTWVAGCASARADNSIGIAGVAFKSKLLFTKQTADNQKNGSIYAAYAGMLYAANQGAKIINCSWGGPSRSQIEQDIINHVTLDLGCLVVAAAGNDDSVAVSYPGGYDHVLSVAATDRDDVRAPFSNFGSTVDLAAPGVAIFTTAYDKTYSAESGTSFSTPITSGAAALVWAKNPSFSAVQVAEQLRVTADEQALYSKNPTFINQLGKGRLDIVRALTLEMPSVRASNPKLINASGFAAQPGDKGFLTLTLTNYLKSTSGGLQVSISSTSSFVSITKGTVTPGIIPGNSSITNSLTPFELTISQGVPENTTVNLLITYSDGSYSDFQVISFFINPSFIDVNSNLINTTVTSIGRIGYQDPANSALGSGFVFNQNPMLYEMGLIMGTSASKLYNNVRGINGNFSQDFSSLIKIKQIAPGERSYSEIFGEFSNSVSPALRALVVDYRSLVWKDAPNDKFVILEYKITNPTTQPLNNFHFGIFADWDITTNGQQDAANWSAAERLGYVYPAQTAAKPLGGIQVLTGTPGYYAIDNDSSIANNPFGIYDGFTLAEKFTTISTLRQTAGTTDPGGNDVSQVISSGPYTIGAGQQITLAFALHAAANLTDLKASAVHADSIYNYTLNAAKPTVDTVKVCYNSPATITATGASAFKWYKTFTGGTSFHTGTQFVTPTLFSDTTFYVSNAEQPYESVRTPAAVIIEANPEVTTSGSTTLCDGQTITLSVATADSYLWSTGETTQTIDVSTADVYSVTVNYTALACQSTSGPVTVSVNPTPHAQFTSSGDLLVGSPQTFTDQSTGAVSWFWEFGDGGTSTDQNPVYTYTQMNDDTVRLTVTTDKGCQDVATSPISVILGLEDANGSILIYPNPVRNEPVKIEVSAQPGSLVRLGLINTLGQNVYEEVFQTIGGKETREIPTRTLSEGIYIVQVKVANRIVTRKIVKAP